MRAPWRFGTRVGEELMARLGKAENRVGRAFGLETLLGKVIGSAPDIAMPMALGNKVRAFYETVARKDMPLIKNIEGTGTSRQGLEVMYERDRQVMLQEGSRTAREMYMQFRQRTAKEPIPSAPLERWKTQLRYALEDIGIKNLPTEGPMITFREFVHEAGVYQRMRQAGHTRPHEIPEINQVVDFYEKTIFRPMAERGVEVGIFPKAVLKNPHWVSQQWNVAAILNDSQQFLSLLQTAFRRQNAERAQKGKPPKWKNLEQEAQDTMNNIIHSPWGITSPFFKDEEILSKYEMKRVLTLPRDMIRDFAPFLENDLEKIAFGYTRTILPRILLKETFGEVGLKEYIKGIKQEYLEMASLPNLTKEQQKEILREMEAMVDYVRATRDIFLGRYKLPDNPGGVLQRVSRGFLQINNMRYLGKVILSQLPDLAGMIREFGWTRSMHTLGSVLMNATNVIKKSEDLQRAIGISETLLHTQMFEQSGILKNFAPQSFVERMLDRASEGFGMLSLMSPWNQMIKTMLALEGSMAAHDIGRKLSLGIELSSTEKNILARFRAGGLSENQLIAAFGEMAKWGDISNGVLFPQTSKWEDKGLARSFELFLRREVDVGTTTPGMFSRPLWAHTTLGRLLGQFRSFSMTATQAILLSGLQYRDSQILHGMLMSIFLGGLVFSLRQVIDGKELPQDPRVYFSEGLDRSGILGWIMDVNNIAEIASRNTLGINPWITGHRVSDWRAMDVYNAFLGPSFGTAADMVRAIGGHLSLQPNRADIKATRRLIPYQGLLYTDWLFDALEEGWGKLWGADQREREGRRVSYGVI